MCRCWTPAAVRAEVASPTYLGGVWYRDTCLMLDPARLAWGLRRACLEAGVRIYEHSPVTAVTSEGRAGLRVLTRDGTVLAGRVALGTGAYRPLLRRLRHYLVPVYDYALVTEPLATAELASIGWRNRQGLADSGNQFHYYRLTADNRILWGGYDAVYYNGGRISAARDASPATFARWPGTSSRPSRSWPASISRTPGAGWSTPAAGSASSPAPPTAGGSPTRPGTPGWGWARPGSAPTPCSTCCTGSRRSGPRWR